MVGLNRARGDSGMKGQREEEEEKEEKIDKELKGRQARIQFAYNDIEYMDTTEKGYTDE